MTWMGFTNRTPMGLENMVGRLHQMPPALWYSICFLLCVCPHYFDVSILVFGFSYPQPWDLTLSMAWHRPELLKFFMFVIYNNVKISPIHKWMLTRDMHHILKTVLRKHVVNQTPIQQKKVITVYKELIGLFTNHMTHQGRGYYKWCWFCFWVMLHLHHVVIPRWKHVKFYLSWIVFQWQNYQQQSSHTLLNS